MIHHVVNRYVAKIIIAFLISIHTETLAAIGVKIQIHMNIFQMVLKRIVVIIYSFFAYSIHKGPRPMGSDAPPPCWRGFQVLNQSGRMLMMCIFIFMYVSRSDRFKVGICSGRFGSLQGLSLPPSLQSFCCANALCVASCRRWSCS